MSWKFARCCLALVLGLVVLAGARADDEKPKEKKKVEIKLPEAHAKCAKACQETIKALNTAGKHAVGKYQEGEKKYVPAIRWIQDCAQTCQLTFAVVIRNGPGHKLICETCAKICDECAKACKDFDDDEMKECAKACTACAKACREMIKGHKDHKKETEEKKPEKKGEDAKAKD